LAKIAVDLEHALARRHEHGNAGGMTPRMVARGHGWTVADVICTSGPPDRSFEEQHTSYTIAMVLAGTFQYRSAGGRALMTPGSLLLGNREQFYECRHEHAEGDRCVSVSYASDYFERLAADAGLRNCDRNFSAARVPPLRSLSPLIARAALGVLGSDRIGWDEVALKLAVETLRLVAGASSDRRVLPANAEARVSRTVRRIDRCPDESLTLEALAAEAGLSPYHFLRTFERLTGVTPHQYVMRARLREAAVRLVAGPDSVLDVALDCGFGDLSNFNRAFRTEFGVSPRKYRRESA